jgi:GT2 family glycosyltransferase
MEKSGISVVMPNWNGKELLRINLPPLIDVMGTCGLKYEIIIIDDASSDGSQQFIRGSYPSIKLTELEHNMGFSAAVNFGARQAKYNLMLLLNSDIKVRKNFLTPLLDYFSDNRTFAVCNKAIKDEKHALTKQSKISFKFGFFREKYIRVDDEPSFSFGASGGHALFDTVKFIEMGGFDEIYSPFYHEDTDLAYRAWKRGYKAYYEPRSIVYHINQATISRAFSRYHISFIFNRNMLIFLWKNLTDADFLLQHFLFLPFQIFKYMIKEPVFLLSFFAALIKLPYIIVSRQQEKKFRKYGDRQVLAMLRQPIEIKHF